MLMFCYVVDVATNLNPLCTSATLMRLWTSIPDITSRPRLGRTNLIYCFQGTSISDRSKISDHISMWIARAHIMRCFRESPPSLTTTRAITSKKKNISLIYCLDQRATKRYTWSRPTIGCTLYLSQRYSPLFGF